MNFTHTEERQMLADMASRFVRERYTIDARHKAAASDEGYDGATFVEMAELGLVGALFPEEAGGFGGAGHDIAVVFEALGSGLVVEPFLATLLAGTCLADTGQAELMEEVVSGATRVTLAYTEPSSRYDLGHVTTKAVEADGEWRLTGHKAVALNADTADKLVVTARISGDDHDGQGIGLFLVDAVAEGVERRPYPTVDGYRMADVFLRDTPATQIAGQGQALAILERAVARATLAVGAEALGAIEVAIALTLDYLKTRKQFGVPIGRFQALQHRMADMMIEREQIRSAVINAAGHIDGDERDFHISVLKNLVGRSGRMIAEEAIQMHGGIAMTWEYAVGHFSKRIVMIDHLFGDVDYHLERVMRRSRKTAA